MFQIEVLGAKHGDCLIINYGTAERVKRILIDGGPPGVYRRFLKPRLKELNEASTRSDPVKFELAMVSHIDSDHIAGLVELTNEMIENEGTRNDPATIKRFWHNSFSDLTGDEPGLNANAAGQAITASFEAGGRTPFKSLEGQDGRAEHILAGLNQGRDLRDNLLKLGLDGNRPINKPLVLRGQDIKLRNGPRLTVVSPNEKRLDDLRQEWNPSLSPVQVAALTDESIANLSSLVVLLEHDQKTVLLTGDARADDILKDLEHLELLEDGKLHVDVLKVMHHGSNRNVDLNFFEKITADIYIYCGDGKHDNPDWDTLEMMRTAREGDDYRVIFSNEMIMQHSEKQPKFDEQVKKLKDAGINIETRDPDKFFFLLDL